MVQHADIDHTGLPGIGGGSGAVVQMKYVRATGADDNTTSASMVDSSLSLAFTPLFDDSILIVSVDGLCYAARVAGTINQRYMNVEIYNSTNTVAIVTETRGLELVATSTASATVYLPIALRGIYVVNSLTARTFKLRYSAGVVTNVNATIANTSVGGTLMTIEELRP